MSSDACPSQDFPNIKAYIIKHLMVAVVGCDLDGRPVGYSYRQMRELILKKFPVNAYPNSYVGKPPRVSIKNIREVCYDAQSIDRTIRLPKRPLSDRKHRDEVLQ
jgi:hypothetical protein